MDRKITVIILILVIIGIVNGQYFRKEFGNTHYLKIIIGSLPNFIGAFTFSILISRALSKIFCSMKRIITYSICFIIFLILTIEEFHPYFSASKTFDYFDILATCMGSLTTILILEYHWKKS